MKIEYLKRHNPWWDGKQGIEKDFSISEWKNKKYRWIPEIVNNINMNKGSVHIITGPRQVGKTTAMKLIIRNLLKVENPEKIVYIRCDELTTSKELVEAIELQKSVFDSFEYLFLDEISNVEKWEGTIKNMYDNGELKNAVVIISGSNAIRIRKSTEYFPGRRGKGKNWIMLPLSFREFIGVVHPELFSKIGRKTDLESEDLKLKAKKLAIHTKELNELLQKYLMCGGFPHPLENYLTSGIIPHNVNDIYLSWFVGDILKAGKSEIVGKQILTALINKMPSVLSWESISKDIEIKSPKTVSSYVESFQNLYVLFLLYFIEPNKKMIDFSKNKKIHFIDPYLFRIFEHWCISDIKNKNEIIIESAVASAIAGYCTKQTDKRINENVFYWKNGYEIDVVANIGKELVGFEVKWGKVKGTNKVGKIKKVIYISKDELSLENNLIIPAYIFLALI